MAEILTNNLLSMLQTNVAETSKTTRENSFLDTGKESFENVLSGLNEKLAPAKNESAPDKKMKPELSGNDPNSQKQNIVSNKNKKFDLQKNVNNKSNDSKNSVEPDKQAPEQTQVKTETDTQTNETKDVVDTTDNKTVENETLETDVSVEPEVTIDVNQSLLLETEITDSDDTQEPLEESVETETEKTAEEDVVIEDKNLIEEENNSSQKQEETKIEINEQKASEQKLLTQPNVQNEETQVVIEKNDAVQPTEQRNVSKENAVAPIMAKPAGELSAQIQFMKNETAVEIKSPVANTVVAPTKTIEQAETTNDLNKIENLEIVESIDVETSQQQATQTVTTTPETTVEATQQTEAAPDVPEVDNTQKTDSKPQLEHKREPERVREVDTETETESDASNADEGFQNSSADIKLVADNLSEKNAFLNSDKSIIFNKILDRSVATTSTQTTQMTSKSDVLNQLNQGLNSLSNENSKVNIVLRPESLGKVSVELQNGKDGLVAKFAVESSQVKDILDKSIENLKNTLSNQGVNVNNISVKVETTASAQNGGFFEFAENGFEQNAQTNSQSQNPNSSNSTTKNSVQEESFEQPELEQTTEQQTQIDNRLGQIDYTI